MGKYQLTMTLKALPDDSLSSGQLKLYAFDGDEAVGCVELYNYDPVNRRAAVGIVVAAELRRHGYAAAMLAELVQFCQCSTPLHQLYADIAAPNIASIRLFERAGYTLCGTFAEWVTKGDAFIDTLRYQYIIESKNQ